MRIWRVETLQGKFTVMSRDGDAPMALGGAGDDLAALLRAGAQIEDLARPLDRDMRDIVRLLPPLRPGKIIAAGLNYRQHLAELRREPPSVPFLFSKFPSCVVGSDEPVIVDPGTAKRVDWEIELAVVVGRPLCGASPGQALESALGYTVANDLSARDIQIDRGELLLGKNLDGFCPLGPAIVSSDAIGDPQDLRIELRVNGETMQRARTDDMVFGVGELLAYASSRFTLEPGDVLLTGSPGGTGEHMNPRRSLEPGDLMEAEIERIGVLRTPFGHRVRVPSPGSAIAP